MQGYIDIHSHILPGVDDGAKNMDETRRMLLIAFEEGIRTMIATPHYITGNNNTSVQSLKNLYEEVNQIARSASEEFHLLLGNELFYSPEIIDDLNNGNALTIDGTRYVLIEFLPSASFHEIRDGLNHCIYAGYIPILAHCERYQCLLKDPRCVLNLITIGAYIQLNYSSIHSKLMDPKTKFCHKLIKNKWVHFLGTDSHGAYERVPRAKETVVFLIKKYGEDTVSQLLWDNPMTMLKNKHL